MQRKILVTSLFFLAVLSVGISSVFAGNEQMISQYKTQMEQYRASYDAVSLGLAQYTNLKTLASQESAVRSLREFLLIRNDVVRTYFEIASEQLSQFPPSNQEWVADGLTRQKELAVALQLHRTQSDVATDRIAVDEQLSWFFSQERNIRVVADRIQTLTAIGKVSGALADLESIHTHIAEWISKNSPNESVRIEEQRGNDEIARTIDRSRSLLLEAESIYSKTVQQQSDTLIYAQIQPKLIDAYAQIQTGVAFAKELTQ